MSDQVFTPGTAIGDYSAAKIVSRGDFGTVYEGKRGRGVYTILGKKADEQWAIDNEIGMMTGLPPHVNVVTFLDNVSKGGMVYFVLENCNIGTLNDFIIKQKPREAFCQSLMLDLARGLFHLHRNKLVHRDIHPDSILLAAGKIRPICKISNFSQAQYCNCYNMLDSVANVLDVTLHTDINSFLKNRCMSKYWPPEVKDPGNSYRFASDIFSMGLVFLSIVIMNIKYDKTHMKDMLHPPVVKKGGSELPLYLCSEQTVKETVQKSVQNEHLRGLLVNMLHPVFGKRPQAGPVVVALESFVPADKSIPIGMIVLLTISVVLLVVFVTWKLTFE